VSERRRLDPLERVVLATAACVSAGLTLALVEVPLLVRRLGPTYGTGLLRPVTWGLTTLLLVCLAAGVSGGLLSLLARRLARIRPALPALAGVLAAPYASWVVRDSTRGGWVSSLPGIEAGRVAATAALCAAAGAALLFGPRLLGRPGGRRRLALAGVLLLAPAGFALNSAFAVGRFAAFHHAAALVVLAALATGWAVWLRLRWQAPPRRRVAAAFLALLALGVGLGARRAGPVADRAVWAWGPGRATDRPQIARNRAIVFHETATLGRVCRTPTYLAGVGSPLGGVAPDPALVARWTARPAPDPGPRRAALPGAAGHPRREPLHGPGRPARLLRLRPGHDPEPRPARGRVGRVRAGLHPGAPLDDIPPGRPDGQWGATLKTGGRAPEVGDLLAGAGYRVFERGHVPIRDPAEQAGAGLEDALADPRRARPLLVLRAYWDTHYPYRPEVARFGDGEGDRYDAALRELDARVGRLLERFPRAVVAVVSDHGEAFGEHGRWQHATTLYDTQSGASSCSASRASRRAG